MNTKKQVIGGLVVLVVLLIGVWGNTQFGQANYEYQGSVFDPPQEALAFELELPDGEIFRLIDNKDHVVLIFFGYTNCPDVCPTTLGDFKQIYEALEGQADQVKFVFITVDPDRDTPERAAEYVAAFHPDFIGLSGNEDQLKPVWNAFFIFSEKEDSQSENYLVGHTSRIIVIDKSGKFRMTFPNGMSPAVMAEDVRHLLAEE